MRAVHACPARLCAPAGDHQPGISLASLEHRVSGPGILLYDLAAGNFCEECGHPKANRLFDLLGTCRTCNEAITRHRCTKLPALADRAPGQEWECPDCGSIWRLVSEEEDCPDCCAECGHTVTRRRWDLAEEGERIGSAPRRKPEPWTPFRNALRETVNVAYARPAPPSLPETCYHTPGGLMVHVKPGCRCYGAADVQGRAEMLDCHLEAFAGSTSQRCSWKRRSHTEPFPSLSFRAGTLRRSRPLHRRRLGSRPGSAVE